MAFEPTTISKALRNNTLLVTYKKATTGKIAKMRCTLQSKLLLKDATRTIITKKTETIRVVDLDKNQWRSIKPANVRKIEVVG